MPREHEPFRRGITRSVSKKDTPFNNPFSNLKLAKPEPAGKPKVPPPPVAPPSKKRSSDDEEAALFLESVGAVAPVRQKVERVGPTLARSVEDVRIPSEEAESLARLAELVSADGEFSLSDSDEFIEGCVVGFDARVMRQLRAGDFPSQANLDLHGLTRDEAKAALEAFIQKSRVAGHRCVLVITGRGLHSQDSIPVLKQSIQAWLTRGKPAKQVLAFCTAASRDGGAGAVYVLLRR